MDSRVIELAKSTPEWHSISSLKVLHGCCEKPLREGKLGDDVYLLDTDKDWVNRWGNDLATGAAPTTNTGAFALQLADMLGADPIFLLGFDMYGDGKRSANYHDLYPESWGTHACVYDRYDDSFLDALRFSKKKIINCNPKSNLYYFPKCTTDDALSVARGELTLDELFPMTRDIGTPHGIFSVRAKSGPAPTTKVQEHTTPAVRLSSLAAANNEFGSLLLVLQKLGQQVDSVLEFGTGKFARSLTAWIAARVGRVETYDVKPVGTPIRTLMGDLARQAHVSLRIKQGDSTYVFFDKDSQDFELLFVDSLHTGEQLKQELDNTHEHVSRYIVIHGIVQYGWNGEDSRLTEIEKKMHSHVAQIGGDGLLPVIFHFLSTHREWMVKRVHTNGQGLIILERVDATE